MAGVTTVEFAQLSAVSGSGPGGAEAGASALVVFAGENLAFGSRTSEIIAPAREAVERAARAAKFKGKSGSALDLLAPQGLGWDRLVVVGTAQKTEEGKKPEPVDYVALGGATAGRLNGAAHAALLVDPPVAPADPAAAAADLALGAMLRRYKFDLYRTKRRTIPTRTRTWTS